MIRIRAGIALALLALLSSNGAYGDAIYEEKTRTWTIVRSLAHDVRRYTQGLEISDRGTLLESTGRYGMSALFETDIETGNTLQQRTIAPYRFGEGLTQWHDRIIMLTWRAGIAQVFDRAFTPLRRWSYRGEGWGLTHDANRLIMSDGSSVIRFRDPDTFDEVGAINVTADNQPVQRLNELEYVDGLILANVWQTDRIAMIDAGSGRVTDWLDLSALRGRMHPDPQSLDPDFVLNGIAYAPKTGHLYVTGKCWPQMFEIDAGMAPTSE